MTALRRLADEPAAILGLVTATTGILMLFGVPLTTEQAGGILTLAGALMALLRQIVTPNRRVVARLDTTGTVVAGPASPITDDTPITVTED